jgi:hypothetical protein
MNIYKKWNESEEKLKAEGLPIGWFKTTKAECLRHTEENGYYKKGTVLKMLEEDVTVFTPFADYHRYARNRSAS